MKLLLLNGPSQDSCDRFFGWPTSLLYAISPTLRAIQSGELALELLRPIFDPVWYEKGCNDMEINAAFVEAIADVDIICASATYDSLHPTLELLREAKRVDKNILTILGGPHVDEIRTLPQITELTQPNSPVDIAVAGDGEYALLTILQNISEQSHPLSHIDTIIGDAWIWMKGQYEFARTKGSPLDLNALPFAPIEYADVIRHKHDFDVFRSPAGGILPTYQTIAQRGCSYDCSFCSEGKRLSNPNPRTVANLMEELDLRSSQGFAAAFFDDSTFGIYRHLGDFLRELRGSSLQFGCLNRFNHLQNKHLVEQYRNAGFVYFYCAIEQFDNVVLRRMNKCITTDTMRSAMVNLHDQGIALGVSLLYGLPYETEDSVKATLDFVAEWVDAGVIKLVSESVLSLHPGTLEGANLISGFDCTPPNPGFPYTRFEEGQWYHPRKVTAKYLEGIVELSERRFGHVLVRNRHSWYRKKGLVMHEGITS
jgi:radical SAM superfamily enzyme YgiQ (UPF0313 family)